MAVNKTLESKRELYRAIENAESEEEISSLMLQLFLNYEF